MIANEFGEAQGLHRSALFAAGLVLFVLTLLVNVHRASARAAAPRAPAARRAHRQSSVENVPPAITADGGLWRIERRPLSSDAWRASRVSPARRRRDRIAARSDPQRHDRRADSAAC